MKPSVDTQRKHSPEAHRVSEVAGLLDPAHGGLIYSHPVMWAGIGVCALRTEKGA